MGKTLSFHKVMFSAQEVLDLLGEWSEEAGDYVGWEGSETGDHIFRKFTDAAEQRSREGN